MTKANMFIAVVAVIIVSMIMYDQGVKRHFVPLTCPAFSWL